jgi:hypothetical protein
MGKNNWHSPKYFERNFSSLSIDTLRFILEQSEKFLEELIKNSENITHKANVLLTITVSLFSLSLSGLVAVFQPNSLVLPLSVEFLKITLVLFTVLFSIVLIILMYPILSYKIFPIGTQTNRLLRQDFFENFETSEGTLKNLLLNECISYQNRITYNEQVNGRRGKYVDTAMLILAFAPFVVPFLSSCIVFFFIS